MVKPSVSIDNIVFKIDCIVADFDADKRSNTGYILTTKLACITIITDRFNGRAQEHNITKIIFKSYTIKSTNQLVNWQLYIFNTNILSQIKKLNIRIVHL